MNNELLGELRRTGICLDTLVRFAASQEGENWAGFACMLELVAEDYSRSLEDLEKKA